MSDFVLFHSNESEFSKEVIWKIERLALKRMFIMVSIDDPSFTIPKYVTCVPTVVSRTTRQTFTDDDIDTLIMRLSKKQKAEESTDTPNPGVLAASDNYKGVTDAYSFIDGPDVLESRSYIPLDGGGGGEMGRGMSGEKKIDDSHYDKYKSQRDADVAALFPRQHPVV